jgi:hypothetical protein
MRTISTSDVVLTAPKYVGAPADKQDLDNQHNGEFLQRLKNDPRFKGPLVIYLGRFTPVEVAVFFNTHHEGPFPERVGSE